MGFLAGRKMHPTQASGLGGEWHIPVSQIFSAINASVPCKNGIIAGILSFVLDLFHGYKLHKSVYAWATCSRDGPSSFSLETGGQSWGHRNCGIKKYQVLAGKEEESKTWSRIRGNKGKGTMEFEGWAERVGDLRQEGLEG